MTQSEIFCKAGKHEYQCGLGACFYCRKADRVLIPYCDRCGSEIIAPEINLIHKDGKDYHKECEVQSEWDK